MSRKIDALIARNIFGCEDWEVESDREDRYYNPDVKEYSTDIAAAWEVLNRFKASCPEINWNDESHTWWVWFYKLPEVMCMSHESAPMSICLAALKAKGIEVSEGE